MAAVVISDASPLIGLARVNGIGWLRELFKEVLIPEVVANEVLTRGFPAEEERLTAALEAGWLRIVSTIPAGPELPDLDEGEAASIRLALAEAGPALLLIDERSGRAIAQELGLSIAGTAAVIGMARQSNLIPSARAVFAQLHGSDFRIAPAVIHAVLRRCGESSSGAAGEA
jgi:predicted nucleic acid-binding protein